MKPSKAKKEAKPAPSFDDLAKLAPTPTPLPVTVQTHTQPQGAEPPASSKAAPLKDIQHRFQAIFHAEDLDRFVALEKALADNSIYRISRNAILKALLRTQHPNEQFITAYKQVINEDRRRKKSSD